MTAPAIWYFDVISPYAYLALARLPEVEAHRPVICRPAVFGAILKHWGQLGPAEIVPKRKHIYRHCAFIAGQMGLPFRLPPMHPFPPLALLRLITALDCSRAATEAAFRMVWGEGKDPNAEATLRAIAEEAGDASAFARIADQQTKDQLSQFTAEAIAAGSFGVPTLIMDGEVFWGLDAMPMALGYLTTPGLFETGEMARMGDVPVGIVRRR